MAGLRSVARGFSTIELLVTIGIVAILAATALPNFRSTTNAAKNLQTANTLYRDIKVAQAEAIRRGVNVVLAPNASPSWASGWCITTTTGSAACGSTDTGKLLNRPALDGLALLTLTGSAAGLQFTPMGNVSSLTGTAVFQACQQNDASSATQQLAVSASGSLVQSRQSTSSTTTGC